MQTSRKQFLRNAAMLAAGSVLPFKNSFGAIKTPGKLPPLDCTDLTTQLMLPYWYGWTNSQSYAKVNSNINIKDVSYADDTEGGCHPPPSCPPSDTSSLIFKICYPSPTLNGDPINKRFPIFIFFHPGGFQECPSYTDDNNVFFCQEMARRGFLTFNCEYRRGILKDPLNAFDYKTVQQEVAAYRGCQDGRGAIRSINKAIQTDYFYNSLGIKGDYTNMFIGGFSAGGVMVLNAAYYKFQSMVNDSYPHISSSSLQNLLGDIEADYYLTQPSFDVNGNYSTPKYRKYIRGVLCGWGGTPVPTTYPDYASQLTFFQSGLGYEYDFPSIISFHGKKDNIFPISPGSGATNAQLVNFSHQPGYYSTDYCFENAGTYTIDFTQSTPDIISASGQNLYQILQLLNKPAEMYVDCNMRHGLTGMVDDPLKYKSDFGTGYTDDNPVLQYMASRTATFFQRILNGYQQTPGENTLFIDCVNTRKGCEPLNSNNCSQASCTIEN